MKINYTKDEAYKLAESLREEFEQVRMVDPMERKVYDIKTCQSTGDVCHDIWGRCNRCENCTSCRALQTHKMSFKLDIKEHDTYLVISKYLVVDGRPMIIEMLNSESNNFLVESSREDEVSCLINNYNHLLVTDPLTETYNRRFLDDHFVVSLDCCGDAAAQLDLAILDIDDFKGINDTYGHAAGDAVLKDVASYWRRHFNSRDINNERMVIRYGGDEFLIIARNMDTYTFEKKVKDAYREMRKSSIYATNVHIPFSITMGFANSAEIKEDFSWSELFDLADKRLYENKKKNK